MRTHIHVHSVISSQTFLISATLMITSPGRGGGVPLVAPALKG